MCGVVLWCKTIIFPKWMVGQTPISVIFWWSFFFLAILNLMFCLLFSLVSVGALGFFVAMFQTLCSAGCSGCFFGSFFIYRFVCFLFILRIKVRVCNKSGGCIWCSFRTVQFIIYKDIYLFLSFCSFSSFLSLKFEPNFQHVIYITEFNLRFWIWGFRTDLFFALYSLCFCACGV